MDDPSRPWPPLPEVEPPLSPSLPPPAPPTDGPAVGWRIAGALLLANAILVLIEKFIMPSAGNGPLEHGPLSGVAPAIHDVVIGVLLLAGERANVSKVRAWALFRCALGGLIFTSIHLSQRDYVSAVMQLAVSGGLMALLAGRPGRARVIAGTSVFGVYALLAVAGIVASVSGVNPLGAPMASAMYDIADAPSSRVTGQLVHYDLTLPGDHWHLRSDASARKDNELADRWLVWPSRDAHVLVVAEKVDEDAAPDVDTLLQNVIENHKTADKGLRVLEQGKLEGRPEARFFHARGTVDQLEVEYLAATFVDGKNLFQVHTFAAPTTFRDIAAELRQILKSFHPSPAR